MKIDRLENMFDKQTKFMEMLRDNDKMPEWPLDLSSKNGQRLIKETIFNMIEELMEASFTLKNKTHRITDDTSVDIKHYKEELGDALAYFMEICILSGFTPEEIYQEYIKKNEIVIKRFESGY